MAGLSMGGIQTLNVGLSHLGTFRYLGIFSSGWFNQPDRQWFYDHKQETVARLNQELRRFWWGWGYTDFARPGSLEITEYLKSKGVRLITRESPGGHDRRDWRLYFSEFVPLCSAEASPDRSGIPTYRGAQLPTCGVTTFARSAHVGCF